MDSITRVIGTSWELVPERNDEGILSIQNLEKRKVLEVELRDSNSAPLDTEYGMVLPWSSAYRHNDTRFIFVRSDKPDTKIKLW